jgi:hypothetical protein
MKIETKIERTKNIAEEHGLSYLEAILTDISMTLPYAGGLTEDDLYELRQAIINRR